MIKNRSAEIALNNTDPNIYPYETSNTISIQELYFQYLQIFFVFRLISSTALDEMLQD